MKISVVNVDPFGVQSPIGDGGMELRTVLSPVDSRDQENYITVEVLDADELVAGRVTFYACLMERDPKNKSAPFCGLLNEPQKLQFPHTLNSASLDNIFTKPEEDAVSSASAEKATKFKFDFTSRLVVQRIMCTEIPLDHHPQSAVTPDAEFDFMVTLEMKRQVFKTIMGKGKVRFPPNLHIPHSGHAGAVQAVLTGPTAYVTFENPKISFEVDPLQMDSETMNVSLFDSEITSLDDPNYVGKATGQLLSLRGMQSGDDVREFAVQLKDVNHMPAGKVVVSLILDDPNSSAPPTTTSTDYPFSPMKTPRKKLMELPRTPRLSNVRIPNRFQNGWVHIHCIAGTALNKFRLIGKHARYEHIREQPLSPVPKHLKQSDLKGLQVLYHYPNMLLHSISFSCCFILYSYHDLFSHFGL